MTTNQMLNEKIDIVIPTSGERLETLLLLLRSLFDQNLSHHRKGSETNIGEVNIYISINPTNIKFEQKVLSKIKNSYDSKIYKLFVLQNKNRGANEARQSGLNSGQHDIVFFFDDDCELQSKNLILNHIKIHQLKIEALAIGGHYKFIGSRFLSLGPFYFQEQNNWYKRGLINPPNRECAYLLGGHFSLKRRLAKQNQLEFDTSMKFGATEKEFFLRALQKKQILIHTRLSVAHHYNFGIITYLRKIFKQGQGNYYIATKGLSFRSIVKQKPAAPVLIHFIFDTTYWLGYYSKQNRLLLLFKNKFHLPKF